MDVSGNARARGFSDVHAQVDAVGVVELAQDGFHALRKRHHLDGRFGWEFAKFVEMRVRDDHHVSRRVRKSIQDDEAVLAAVNDQCLGVIVSFHGVAEDASGGLLGGRNVGITPWCPEVVHHKAG